MSQINPVRRATAWDATAIARLSAELGYPAPVDIIQNRLKYILTDPRVLIAVTTDTEGRVVGWIHSYLVQLVESDLRAEIGGLVVEASYRRLGLGTALVSVVRHWAAEAGAQCVTVRCHSIRQDAHQFYQHFGFILVKEQLVFRHALPSHTHAAFSSPRRLSEL